MARDLLPAGKKNCYACIQWEGNRTYYADTKMIKADRREEGLCLIMKIKKMGGHTCGHFDQLR